MCHEVRVPLNTISMGTDAIGETLQDLQGSVQANSEASTAITTAGQLGHPSRAAGSELAAVSEAQYLLRSVHTAARSLDTLVGDVLQMEKIELGKFDIEPERVDIKTILEDLVASFEPDASRRGCHLHFVWATPPGPVPVIFGPSRNSNRVARVRTRAQGMWLRAWSGAAGPHGPVQEHARRSSALAASLLPSRAEDDATTRRRGSATFDSLASDATDVLVDPNRVHQVVANLVSNALKFADGQVTVLAGFAHAPPGGPDKAAPAPTPKLASLSPMACQHRGSAGAPDPGAPLSTGTARRDSSTSSTAPEKRVVCIAVCDNGIGLRKGEANQLFRAFAQIRPGASQSGKGTGLGLAICHAICGLHGGTISAWSPGEGAGSVFWLALPVLVFPSRSAPNSTPAPGLVASAAERKTKDAPPLVPDMGERAEWGPEGSTPTVSPRRRGVVATAGRSPTTSATRRRGGTSDAPPQAQCPLSRSPVACAPRKGRSGSCRTELIGSSDLMPLPEQGNSSPVVGPPSRLSTHATMQAEESDSGLGEGADAGAGSGPGASPVRVQSPCHPRDVSRVVTASSIVPLRPAQGVEAAQGDVATGEAFDDREAAHHLNLPPASSRALAAAAPTAAVPSVSTATAATAAAVGPAPAASASPPQERPLRGARMLVVEDSRSSRELLVRMLGRLGATSIDEAENGAEALDVMQREKERGRTSSSAFGGIHAVLTDSNMPVMSGQEAVQIMRQMGYQGTVVGVTGAASDGEVEAFRAAGADTVVPKPVKKEALLSTLLPILPALGQVEAGPNPT